MINLRQKEDILQDDGMSKEVSQEGGTLQNLCTSQSSPNMQEIKKQSPRGTS